MSWLSEELYVIPGFKWFEEKTGIPCSILALFILVWQLYKFFSGDYNDEIILVIGSFYPFLKSLQALQTDTDVEDDKTWLTYWMCFGTFTIFDMHTDFILDIIPFYYTMKLLFLLWLQLPLGPLMGANIVYKFFLNPIFKVIGPWINKFAERHADDVYAMRREAEANFADVKKSGMEAGTNYFVERAMNKMMSENTAENTPDEAEEE